MKTSAECWKHLRRRCDPSRPALPDEQTRRAQGYDPTRTILGKLRMDPERRCHLALTGSVGTGKSSELAMLAEGALTDRTVVHFDLHQHLVATVRDASALDRLAPWEVLSLVGLAVARATESLPLEQARAGLGRAIVALQPNEGEGPTLDVGKLISAMWVGFGLFAAGTPAATLAFVKPLVDATSWRLRLGRSAPPRDDQDGEVRALLQAVNTLILAAQRVYARPTLVVVDGLDRLIELEAVLRLFVRSSLLAELECDLVVTAPLVLQRRLLSQLRGFDTVQVRNVPVLDRSDARKPTDHVRFFIELAGKRVAAVQAGWVPLTDTQLTRLAWASGGRARDFVELLLLVCEVAFSAGSDIATDAQVEEAAPPLRITRFAALSSDVATDAQVEEAIDQLRRKREEGLTRHQVDVLRQVMQDPDHLLPNDDPVALGLIEQHKLLPYPNQSTWYHPHPLLLLHQLR